jgi:polyisoprenyl-phosphate glycosyltransferase
MEQVEKTQKTTATRSQPLAVTMRDTLYTISVVVPAYNEAACLPQLLKMLSVTLKEYPAFEIIVVDDGSSDGTSALLEEAAAANACVQFVSLSRNFGHQAALRAGLAYASGDAVISMDADLQHPIELLDSMIQIWRQGYDVVTTTRIDAQTNSLAKRLASRAYYWLLNFLSDTKVEPGSADFRLLDRKVVDTINGLQESEIFFRNLVPWLGFRSTQVAYVPNPRAAGASKYKVRKMISLAVSGIVSSSIRPLRFAMFLASIIAIGIAIYACYTIFEYFAYGDLVPGWATVVVAVCVIGALQLTVLGVIGEYLGRVLRQTRGRPSYIVTKTSFGAQTNRSR